MTFLLRWVSNMLFDVPFPTPVRPKVMMSIGDSDIQFNQPLTTQIPIRWIWKIQSFKPDQKMDISVLLWSFLAKIWTDPFSPSGGTFSALVQCLEPDHVLDVFCQLLLEKEVLLLSSSPMKLTGKGNSFFLISDTPTHTVHPNTFRKVTPFLQL